MQQLIFGTTKPCVDIEMTRGSLMALFEKVQGLTKLPEIINAANESC